MSFCWLRGEMFVLLDLDNDERSWRRLATGDDVKSRSFDSQDIAHCSTPRALERAQGCSAQ